MSRQNKDGSYTIPAARVSVLRAGVEKLNRRARKLGMPEVTLTVGEERRVFVTETDAHLAPEVRKVRYVVDVALGGAVPRVNGFAFCAKLDHLEGGNLVLRAPGYEGDLDGWRVASSRCQHCGLDRHRAQTFLVADPNGNLIQVGRQCLADYIRGGDVEAAVGLFKCWQELLDGCGDEEGGWGWGGYYDPTTPLDYVAAAVSSIRIRGFHKSGGFERDEGEGKMSTRTHCDFILGPRPKPSERTGDELGREWGAAQPTELQRVEAAAIVAWVLASNDSSDYMHNARLACAERTLRARTEGLLASLPHSYARHLGKEAEQRERPAAGPHVGAVGEKIACKVRVVYSTGYESEVRGGRILTSGTVVIMTDEHNSTIKAFTSSSEIARCEDFSGEWYLYATVKKHLTDAKRGHAVTLVKRIVLRRDPAPEKPAARKRAPRKAKPEEPSAPTPVSHEPLIGAAS